MKTPQNAESDADEAGSSQPGCSTESKTPDIKESQEPSTTAGNILPETRD